MKDKSKTTYRSQLDLVTDHDWRENQFLDWLQSRERVMYNSILKEISIPGRKPEQIPSTLLQSEDGDFITSKSVTRSGRVANKTSSTNARKGGGRLSMYISSAFDEEEDDDEVLAPDKSR